jgi:hypothetical protein
MRRLPKCGPSKGKERPSIYQTVAKLSQLSRMRELSYFQLRSWQFWNFPHGTNDGEHLLTAPSCSASLRGHWSSFFELVLELGILTARATEAMHKTKSQFT